MRPLRSSGKDIKHGAVFPQQQYMGSHDQILFCISYSSVTTARIFATSYYSVVYVSKSICTDSYCQSVYTSDESAI